MNLELYTTGEGINVADKNPSIIGNAIVLNPNGIISRESFTAIIDYNSAFLNANYAKLPLFNRYYYVTVSIDIAGKMIVTGTVDPVYSFLSAIKNCKCVAVRNEKVGISYIQDDKLPVLPNNHNITAIHFSNSPFDTGLLNSYLLTVLGGANS